MIITPKGKTSKESQTYKMIRLLNIAEGSRVVDPRLISPRESQANSVSFSAQDSEGKWYDITLGAYEFRALQTWFTQAPLEDGDQRW